MYRSNRRKEDDPIVLQHPISEFQDGVEVPYLVEPTFMERVTTLPLVRTVFGRAQEMYFNAKERSSLLNTALTYGESTVQFSLHTTATILNCTGITSYLEKPKQVADVIGCHFLDKVQNKVPVITKTPYEIKLMVGQKVEEQVDQLQSAKEAMGERVRDYKRKGSDVMESVKQLGADKVHAMMDTDYGRQVNHVIEYGLDTVDEVVEKYLPESHSHKNGSASNGHVTTNGFHIDNLGRVKKISYKVTRRLSLRVQATSHNVVDAVIATPAVSALHSTIVFARHSFGKPVQFVKEKLAFAVAKAYVTMVDCVAKVADLTQMTMLTVLPGFISQPLNVLLDRSVTFLTKSGFHIPPPVEIPDELLEN